MSDWWCLEVHFQKAGVCRWVEQGNGSHEGTRSFPPSGNKKGWDWIHIAGLWNVTHRTARGGQRSNTFPHRVDHVYKVRGWSRQIPWLCHRPHTKNRTRGAAQLPRGFLALGFLEGRGKAWSLLKMWLQNILRMVHLLQILLKIISRVFQL